ncbi:MAG: mechanosensitive ion channel family protein [Ignavibacteriaceae bacterium]
MHDFLNQTYFGNTILTFITAVVIFLIGIIIINIFRKIILSRLKKWAEKTETSLDDFLIRGIEKAVIPLLYYGAFYLAAKTLAIPSKAEMLLNTISVILITFLALRVLTSFISYSLGVYVRKKGAGEAKEKEFKGITTILTLIVWALGLVFLLDNLGFKVASVIAGLGVGGIAIALAAQAVLGDLFAYFVIFFDRPFEIGDFIIVGDKLGSIEYIGLKTTRLRSLGGEQLVFSNKDLTDSRIHNYKRMERRRIVFRLGVIYQTKAEHLKEIPGIVRKIIEDTEKTTFDRGHFANYGDFSLNFEFVYYVLSPDYNIYMDTQQAINLKIFDEFEKRGIEFAFPTQTLFLNKENWNGSEIAK